MSGPVLDEFYQRLVLAEEFEKCIHKVEVCLLIVSADIVDFAILTFFKDESKSFYDLINLHHLPQQLIQ